MDKAKATVESLLSRKDKHDVTVDEQTAPALMNETVHKSKHEDVQQVVDREVHKTHHHTTLQPVKDQEVRPEVHEHVAHGVEERVMQHGDRSGLDRGLAAEKEKFRDRQHVMPTQVTESVAPTMVGEHVHHHIVETVQPVIQKDTHHSTVVHHTKPVHEVHHHAPQHHEATALPAVSMDQFRSQGGSLTGRSGTHDEFAGHRDIEGVLGHASGMGANTSHHAGNSGLTGTTGTGTGYGSHTGTTGAGPHNSSMENKLDPRVDSDGSKGYGTGATTSGAGSGYGSNTGTTGAGTGYGSHTGTTGAGPHNSSMENKLDPRVDSDGSKGYGTGATTSGAGSGYGSQTGTAGAGPHNSSMENKLDPRVDSDGSKGYGSGATTSGTGTGSGTTTGTTPHHNSNLLNKLDPRVKN